MFDSNGKLVNRQHLLLAVVKADIPVQFEVLHNASKEELAACDTGKTSSHGKVFRVHKYNASKRALYHFVTNQGLPKRRGLSLKEDKSMNI